MVIAWKLEPVHASFFLHTWSQRMCTDLPAEWYRNFHSACAFSSCHFSRYCYFYLSDGNFGAKKNIKSLAQRYTASKRQGSEPQSVTAEQLASRHGCAVSQKSGWRFWEAELAIQGSEVLDLAEIRETEEKLERVPSQCYNMVLARIHFNFYLRRINGDFGV